MKKLFYFVGMAVIALSMASCQKETALQQTEEAAATENQFGETVFTLTATVDDTKTSLDGLKVKWEAGDQISVNGVISKPLANSGTGSEVTFEFDQVLDAPYSAVYPASAVAETTEDGTYVVLPKTQDYVAGGFDPAAAVLVGTSTDPATISFAHAVTYLKLSFDKAVKSVRVMANNGMRVRGRMTANFEEKGLENYYSTTNYNYVTLAVSEGSIPAKAPVIIAIPAKNYGEGLNIMVVTADDKYQILKTSALDASQRKGEILTKAATLTALADYQGPGIYCETDWRSFVCADESSFTTDLTQKESAADFLGADGEYNIYADITAATNFQRHGSNIADLPGINSGDLYFYGTLDGNNHTLTQNASTVPLISYVGSHETEGEIKNLTLDGNCTAISNASWGNAALAIRVFRKGTLRNCVNKINTSYIETKAISDGLYIGGLVTANGGLITNCKNKGNMYFELIVPAEEHSYNNRAFIAGGISSSANHESSCGDFVQCENSGYIKLVKKSVSGATLSTCFSRGIIGGICGRVQLGTSGDNYTGAYTRFESCTNSGNLTFWEDEHSGASTGEQLPFFMGGILGVSTIFGNSCCPDFAQQYGYYFIVSSATNNGTLDISTSSISAMSNKMTGARQTYVGGLVGFAMGSYGSYPIVRGKQTGTIKLGSSNGSECAGGVIGGASYVKLDYIANSVTTFALSENPEITTKKVGAIAGLIGWTIKRTQVYPNANGTTTVKMDASQIGATAEVYGQGIAGITGAASLGAQATAVTTDSQYPFLIFENGSNGSKVQFAGKKADGLGFTEGAVESKSDRDCIYGGYCKSGNIQRTSGNLVVVAY